jgi:hypothetical protein
LADVRASSFILKKKIEPTAPTANGCLQSLSSLVWLELDFPGLSPWIARRRIVDDKNLKPLVWNECSASKDKQSNHH